MHLFAVKDKHQGTSEARKKPSNGGHKYQQQQCLPCKSGSFTLWIRRQPETFLKLPSKTALWSGKRSHTGSAIFVSLPFRDVYVIQKVVTSLSQP